MRGKKVALQREGRRLSVTLVNLQVSDGFTCSTMMRCSRCRTKTCRRPFFHTSLAMALFDKAGFPTSETLLFSFTDREVSRDV
jgi:hypothetical protein